MKRLLLLPLLLFATPALAQNGQGAPAATPAKASEFETVSLAVYGPCQRATFTDMAAAVSAETTCAKLITDLDLVKQAAGANVTPHDMNIFHVLKSTGTLRVSRAWYMQDSNTRTARVCAKAEDAWTHASQVNMAASSADYVKLMQPLVTDVASFTRLCRTERGVPANAIPLPA